MNNENNEVKIGNYILNKDESTLESAEKSVKLEPLTLTFLCFLLEKKTQIVSREDLLAHVWENRIVSDDSIRKVVKKLREAFGDDAKSPRYIKTVPLKGYCLVAVVMPVANVEQQKKVRTIVKISVVFFFALFALYWAYADFFNTSADTGNKQVLPNIERLTELSGSELGGNYHAKLNLLVFLHRINNTDPWQIFSKNTQTGLVQRLTWDSGNYQNIMLSPDGKKIVYWHIDNAIKNTYIANFHPEKGLSKVSQLNPTGQYYIPLSWSVGGKAIYLTNYATNKETQALFQLDLDSKSIKQLTFPNTGGYGDYLAQESPDGKHLAVLTNVSDRKYMLFIIERSSKKVKVRKAISFFASTLLWQDDGESLAMSSFKGDFYYYSVTKDKFIEQKGSTPGLNDAFYQCGDKCFYMRQHDMNYNDIKEIPNPFVAQTQRATLHIESTKAEFHPFYNASADTLYYVSKDTKQAKLIRHVLGKKPETLYRFNARYIVTDLSLNKQETLLLGKVEERIFLLDLVSKELSFLTSALEIVSNPTWNSAGNSVYFSRVEQHKSVMLQYDIKTDRLIKIAAGIIHRKELSDGRIFVANDKNELHEVMADKSKRFVIKLPVVMNNHWHVQGDYLYFNQSTGNDFYLGRLTLSTKVLESHLLAKNSWEKGFNLHPDGNRLLITQSLLANSNLVRVDW